MREIEPLVGWCRQSENIIQWLPKCTFHLVYSCRYRNIRVMREVLIRALNIILLYSFIHSYVQLTLLMYSKDTVLYCRYYKEPFVFIFIARNYLYIRIINGSAKSHTFFCIVLVAFQNSWTKEGHKVLSTACPSLFTRRYLQFQLSVSKRRKNIAFTVSICQVLYLKSGLYLQPFLCRASCCKRRVLTLKQLLLFMIEMSGSYWEESR
jgi:hypothetical protein